SYSKNSENIASLLYTNELNAKLRSEIELRLQRLGPISGILALSASSPVLRLSLSKTLRSEILDLKTLIKNP
ncbi:hypothetical protein PanWU01x14_343490, partial [Parasponia andersonii]